MLKTIIVENLEEILELEALVKTSMDKASTQLTRELHDNNPISAFSKMKFGGVGFDPLDCNRELNIIEQINQSFTYLASFYALEVLFSKHLELAPFKLNLGTAPGSDIESVCGVLAAEVFASVTPSNNQKLKKDIDKVLGTDAQFKYAFFMCPKFELGRQNKFERDGVTVWALKGAQALL